MIKRIIKKLAPKFLINFYHKFLAIFASYLYGNPSNKLIIIGVTGTNGKSTTISLISHILEGAGYKVGSTSTAEFKIGNKVWLNDQKMTMLGRFKLQKLLYKMFKEKCEYVVVETSSEGIKQFRHLGINYDFVAFTNLTPEHIESHGSFENYKNCKLELFKHLTKYKNKNINGEEIKKMMSVNRDDKNSGYFLSFDANKKVGFSINKESDYQAKSIELKSQTKFIVKQCEFKTNLIGQFNVYNCLCAISVCNTLGISLENCAQAIENYKGAPGRMEFINCGQDFKVIVDYAPEIESMRNLYSILDYFYYEKLIHVLGSCGGGRDRDRQPILGKMAGEKANFVIITNEDPYDDDPIEIIDNVASGAIESGKEINKNLFKISDRRLAIRKAIELAGKDDLVLITGKGSEQFICVKNEKKIPWDDRIIVGEELKSRLNN